ncbi:MAG: phosphodiesterase [Elusimicrobia bacterium]|nr:phosphodiesterase [Elusimicrobiota bacterium]
MKIGVVSDLHGSLLAFEKTSHLFRMRKVELILNAGDVFNYGPRNPWPEGYAPGDLVKALNGLSIPMIIAQGNCDSEVDQAALNVPLLSPCVFVYVDGKKIVVNHGHKLSDDEKIQLAKRLNIDIFIVGHTHLPKLERLEKMILLNPGSPALPKGSPTAGTIEITDTETNIEIFNIDTGNVVMR